MEESPRLEKPVSAVRRRLLRTGVSDAAKVMPSLLAQIQNLATTAAHVGVGIVQGKPLLRTEAEQERCLAVCKGCDRWDAMRKRCGECGCYSAVKARLKSADCPLGKWGN